MEDLTNILDDRCTAPFGAEDSTLSRYSFDPSSLREGAIENLPQLRFDREGSPVEVQAVESWADRFHLDTSQWGTFLTAWSRALQAFHTPLSFLDSLANKRVTLSLDGASFEVHEVSFERRDALVALYNKLYPIKANRDDYGPGRLIIPESCALCECVAKAEDDKEADDIASSVTFMELGGFSLMVNRFPWEPGNLLLMPSSHDLQVRSSLPLSQTPSIQIQESGMTWGTPSAHYLETMFSVADLFDFVAIRNHPESGMSQPQHDHAHCFPSDLPKGFIPRTLAARMKEAGQLSDEITVSESSLTPFSVLTLAATDRAALAKRGSILLRNLERADHVPVCSYYGGVLSVGVLVQKDIRPEERSRFGARVLLNYFTHSELQNFHLTSRYFPMAGQFKWKKYL